MPFGIAADDRGTQQLLGQFDHATVLDGGVGRDVGASLAASGPGGAEACPVFRCWRRGQRRQIWQRSCRYCRLLLAGYRSVRR